MVSLFRRFRSVADAKRAIGTAVKFEGHTYHCAGANDLGCLYWRRSDWAQKLIYWDALDQAAGFPRD